MQYDKWCNENIPPKKPNLFGRILVKLILRAGCTMEGKLQRRLRVLALNTFLTVYWIKKNLY